MGRGGTRKKKGTDTDGDRLIRFAKLVKAMRAVQVRFFSGDRSAECVRLAKDFEARVDRAAAWVLGDRRKQGRLFGGKGKGRG